MLTITAVESVLTYDFKVTDETTENTYVYSWGKEPNEGQYLTDYIQQCKNEALLLVQWEIDQKAKPMSIQL